MYWRCFNFAKLGSSLPTSWRSSLTTYPVVLSQETPLHLQQLWPFQESNLPPGSGKPFLNFISALLSESLQFFTSFSYWQVPKLMKPLHKRISKQKELKENWSTHLALLLSWYEPLPTLYFLKVNDTAWLRGNDSPLINCRNFTRPWCQIFYQRWHALSII